MQLNGLRPVSSRHRDSVRAAFVVVTVIAGTGLVASSVFVGSDNWSASLFLLGPPLLGAFAALVAGGRAPLLALAAGAFVAVGIAVAIVLGAGGLAEGGALVIPWVVANEIAGLYGAVGLSRLARHIRARSS
jgi:hypothetical protein